MQDIRNSNGKLVCRVDASARIVEIVHKGICTIVHILDNGTCEVINTKAVKAV
ncbi:MULTISPECIES: hypothetical protein [Enterococcus]|jgi:hypothetical protein|uniref:hypothetical protein n=1 Tax=Enterococcus TaxID=1350 RepID=UPI0015C9CFDE|nr:hypothetical protein [Enterococcus faecium]EME3524863.1 hypothetical protein [Enterococcus faecium]EME8267966.1 hypothetical protein [Enterococcus faecium]EMF0292441.1 hypothetical protein [Enterococcus faecium]EMF0468905.1 hypothetical protein [Enterococcus faecium]EMF0546763.1 hypothetical protein [Enterococcus faecium]